MSLNRWGRRRAGAANAKLLRLFHAHFVCVLEDPVCVHPTDRVLEWLGMFHCVNLSHWFPNRYYWRPCIPFWLHSWPERHRHCSGFCRTGDFTSWWVILLVKGFIDIQRHIVRCQAVQFAHFTPLNSNGRCIKEKNLGSTVFIAEVHISFAFARFLLQCWKWCEYSPIEKNKSSFMS